MSGTLPATRLYGPRALRQSLTAIKLRRYVFLTMYERSLSSYATPWHHDHLITFFRHLLHHVNHLHLLNISHEDLKRSNVLIDKKGNPVLVDFGFSHFSVDGQKVKSAGGTLDYTSPEKVMVSLASLSQIESS